MREKSAISDSRARVYRTKGVRVHQEAKISEANLSPEVQKVLRSKTDFTMRAVTQKSKAKPWQKAKVMLESYDYVLNARKL